MTDDPEDIEDDEDAEVEEKPKKNLLKLGLFIGLPVVILLLGAVAAFMFFSGGDEDELVVAECAEGEHCEVTDADGEGDHHEVASVNYRLVDDDADDGYFMYDIRSTDGRPMKVRLLLSVQSSDPEFGHILVEHLPSVMDQFQAFVRELREDDLYGSAGNYRLKLELLRRINLVVEPSHADEVLIEEMLMVD
jgi:flagellar FliL protein